MFTKSILSKLGLAAAVVAIGGFATVDLAEARGDGFGHRWSGKFEHVGYTPNKWGGGNFANACVAVAKTRHGNGRRIGNIRAKAFGRRACRKAMNRCQNVLFDRRQSRGRNPHAECVVVRRPAVQASCMAVAKTRHGNGNRIGNIRAEAFGHRACRKAKNRCQNILFDRRQARGRNPHAECVVVRQSNNRHSHRH